MSTYLRAGMFLWTVNSAGWTALGLYIPYLPALMLGVGCAGAAYVWWSLAKNQGATYSRREP